MLMSAMDYRRRRWAQRVRSCYIKVMSITFTLGKGILGKLKTNEMMTWRMMWRTLGDDIANMVDNG